jgi:TRAP-type C4-dicarboxylate transport system substrate-binding protein
MKKERCFLKMFGALIAFLMCIVFALSACGGSTSDTTDASNATADAAELSMTEEDVYEFSANFIPQAGSPTINAYEYIKAYLNEKSGGRIVMNIFPGGQLGSSETENTEVCAQNIFQMTSAATHTLAQYGGFTEYSATTVPFLFTTPEQVDIYIDSDMLKTVNEKFTEKTGLRIYGGFSDGLTCIATADTPFVTPQDLKGVKIRSQEAANYVDMYNEMGISPIPMAGGEIFTAIQQGTIEGLSGIPAMVVNNRFYEVCKYLTDINALVNYHILVVNDQRRSVLL